MKLTVFVAILLLLTLTACGKNKSDEEPFVPTTKANPASAPALPPGHPSMTQVPTMAVPASAPAYVQSQTATVISTIDVPEFTYLEVTQNGTTRWLAAKTVPAKKGDVIKFDNGATMANFKSKSLNRTFDTITFVNSVTISK